MQNTSQDKYDQQQRATLVGGLKGLLGGLAVSLPASYIMHRRWPAYRALTPALKTLGVIIVTVPSFVISAERATLRFEREQWTGAGKEELDTLEERERRRWERLSLGEKMRDLAARHEYGFIGGAWALSMVTAFSIIMRNPYQSLPQKVVQARLWAQGLTVGVLIAAGALTHSRHMRESEDGRRHLQADHSWRDVLEAEERARKQGK
ncbi:hypothetical protein OBBRIDRAFT_559092 [Obba rivulosa]|uniref:HIG1 domain-containing protein n=1 Tax=Obba rivulosa TaxID=1052685 RepID=A0A8E2AXI2_9APHY|nr:hypothetical protein OBBRIDRAFT_559092 [Obba rivulosa]